MMKKKFMIRCFLIVSSFYFVSLTCFTHAQAVEKLILKDSITGQVLSHFTESGVYQIFDPDQAAGYSAFIHDHAANNGNYPRTYFYGLSAGASPANYGFYVAEKHAVGSTQVASFLGLSTNTDVKQAASKQLAFYVNTSKAFISTWTAENAGGAPALDLYVGGSRLDGSNSAMVIKTNGQIGIGTSIPTHLLQLSGGAYSDGATWVNASSRELKENIKEVSAEEAVATLAKLEPVQYNYKANKEEQYVGFIAEDVPDMVAVNDRKGLSAMDITAVLTKVVQEQQKTIAELQERLAEVEIAMQFKKDKDLALTMLQK